MEKEAKARIKINKLLEEAGWRLFNSDKESANVQVETNVKLEELGDDFEQASDGYIDYLLLDSDGFPIAVLEAKSEEKDPLDGKEQARRYANSQGVRFVILSNGNLHYFWDKELGNPTRISHFPTLESLQGNKQFMPDPEKLAGEEVQNDYIALTQKPNYADDPRWQDESQQNDFIYTAGLRFLRPYQLDAIRAIQRSVAEGKNRFLFEMATGTGKTLLAGAIIKLFIKTGNARRILFLVDRLELEDQAKKAFDTYLKPDFQTSVFKERRDDWRQADIVITTVQSISHNNKYLKTFAPNDFDLVISDESHRSISGNSRAIFEYFIGYKLGLTATPKDYLRNLSQKDLNERDPREIERRLLLSTYQTFGCESGNPTFRYALEDGARDGYLVLPTAIDCRTEITTQLLSDEGYAIHVQNEEGEDEEVIYHQSDFERKFFSEKTNAEFVKTFMENAKRDPISDEIGKTIIFAVSRTHARKLTQILNEYAHEMFPGKYNSDFAVQITSDIPGAQKMAQSFANNNLNGKTSFLDGYKSSKTRVSVTVGMMTTGYDCEDILNLCLMRPIFSPTDFVQIKGRGTRKYRFNYQSDGETVTHEKDTFKLFDFFANIEYFEEKYPYDEVVRLPSGTGTDSGPMPPPPKPEITTVHQPDPLAKIEVMDFEGGVMRVDRELYKSKFEEIIQAAAQEDETFKELDESGRYLERDHYVKETYFNKPEEYFTLETVRKLYEPQVDRRLTLREIIDKILGRIRHFKTKDELAEEQFEQFLVASDIPPNLYYEAREFFTRYLIDEDFRTLINQKRYGELAGDPLMTRMLQKLGRERIQEIPEYIKDNVQLNQFV